MSKDRKRTKLVMIIISGVAMVAFLTFLAVVPTIRNEGPNRAPKSSVEPARPVGKPEALDPGEVKRGEAVYRSYCLSCHGPKGIGSPNWRVQNSDMTFPPPPHDSTGHTWHHADDVLYGIVRDGGKKFEDPGFKSAMPAYSDKLSADEVDAVISYLKSLWKPQERASQAEVNAGDTSRLTAPKGAGR